MSKITHITGLTMAACLVSLAPSAFAQSANEPHKLDTITVKGEKAEAQGDEVGPSYAGGQVGTSARIGIFGEQDVMDVPFNVTSYTEELIENQQASTLGDVLKNDASVTHGMGFGTNGEYFKLRGFELQGNDVSYGGLYGVLPRQFIDSSMMGQVEVFKGASSFLYGVPPGNSGIGGTVNIEPKRATDLPITRLSAGYETDSFGEVGVDVGRRFGEQNQFGVRANLKRGRGDMTIDNDYRKNTNGVIGLDYRGERARLSLDLGHQTARIKGGRKEVSISDEGITEISHAPDSKLNYFPDWPDADLKTTFAMTRGEFDFNDNWTAFAAVGGSDTHERSLSGSLNWDHPNGDASSGSRKSNTEYHNLSTQVGLRGAFETGDITHKVNMAFSSAYERNNLATRYNIQPIGAKGRETTPVTNLYHPWPNVPINYKEYKGEDWDNPELKRRVRNEGFSLADTLGFFGDRVLLTLGARYQEIDDFTNGQAGTIDKDNHYSKSRVSPVYGVVYRVIDEISLYANHIEGLQTGVAVPESGRKRITNARETLDIINAKQNEFGAKFDYGKIGGGIALFQIEQPRQSIMDNDDGSVTYGYYNELRSRGIEVNLYGEPLENLRLLSSAAWYNPEFSKSTVGQKGNDAPGVANYRYILGAEWDLPYLRDVTATGRVTRSGSEFADPENTLETDAWTRLDIGLRYTMPFRNGSWVWRLGVDNVTDEDYWESASSTGHKSILQGEPRTVKLSATIDL